LVSFDGKSPQNCGKCVGVGEAFALAKASPRENLGISPSTANTVRLSRVSTLISVRVGGLWLYSCGFNRHLTLNRTVLQVQHLFKTGGSNQRLFAARNLLWHEKVDETILLFSDCDLKQAENFCTYLEKYRHRIINYYYFQTELLGFVAWSGDPTARTPQICSIGSGSIESTIKQIDRRTKISGAQ
jgi:hypothetical protein